MKYEGGTSNMQHCIFVTLVAFLLYTDIITADKCTYTKSYKTSCGWWGVDRCRRYRIAYRCCPGWQGRSCTTPVCEHHCKNGGTCDSSGSCTCPDEYYGRWCLDRCPRISNCIREQCSTSSNVVCTACDGDYGASGSAYMKSSDSRSCIKQCSWRSNSNACFPGSCSNGNCQCTTGFGGADCRTMSSQQRPTISYKSIKLHSMNNVVESSSDTSVYTNLQPINSAQLTWTGLYQPDGLPSYNNIPYINSINLGVVSGAGSITKTGSSRETLQKTCPNSGSNSNPEKGIVDCDVNSEDVSAWNIRSGDEITATFKLESGGNMKLYNRDSSNTIITRNYNGRTTTESATMIFDFDQPVHCVRTSNCKATVLNVGMDVTSNALVGVSWEDWSDALSGIEEYHLEVRRMTPNGNTLSESYNRDQPVNSTTTSATTRDIEVPLPESGMYSFVLSVVDKAGNQKLARRFVLFNNETTGPAVNEDHPIRVSSAAPHTNFNWITKIDTPLVRVDLTWEGHFESLFYYRLLIPINEHPSGLVENAYDQTSGTVNRNGISNKLGVTQFRSHFNVDHRGGRTILSPNTPDTELWQNEGITVQQTYNIQVTDGDSIRFWIEARDIMGHSASDSVLVHVDSSPPRLEEFWLQRNGEIQLSVHNTSNLRDMRIHFKAYDIHSGLRTIHYELYNTKNDATKMVMALPVTRVDPSECQPPNCVCIPLGECYDTEFEVVPDFHIGRHDYDYAIRLSVTNNAGLITNDTLKITIDTSPPIAGFVHDGKPEDDDIDFQSEYTLYAHWDGFFDKESGVKFYEYIIDVKCWDTLSTATVTRTTSTHLSWHAFFGGSYFVTVVAYNHALDPSSAVCSDGVTIDRTPPHLFDIRIENSRVQPGLVSDIENNIWEVDANVEYKKVVDASNSCRSNSRRGVTLTWFEPSTHYENVTIDDCEMRSPPGDQIFIAADKHIHISWLGWDDESRIYDYNIALSSVASDLLPDIMSYVSASGKQHITLQHPGITHGTIFYLIVKAVNKAQITSSKVFGPVVVDLTPPEFEGLLDITINSSCLHVCWERSAFFEDVDNDLHFKIAIGSRSHESSVDILPFTDIAVFTNPSIVTNPICISIPRESLNGDLHESQEYQVSVKATNAVGLSVAAVASFRHTMILPSDGVVWDILPADQLVKQFQDTRPGSSDVDVQLSNSSIRAYWFGFYHPHLELAFLFGVGSRPGNVDVSNGYVFVGNKTDHEEFGLQLQYRKTYYVSIVAVCETGNITVTSDGVTPMKMDTELHDSIRILDRVQCNKDCEEDIDFQLSTSVVQASWNIFSMSPMLITNVYWSLEQMQATDEGTVSWTGREKYKDIGFTDNHIETGLELVTGGFYRSKVMFCFHSVCYKPVTSDGFGITNDPPVGGTIDVSFERQHGYMDIDVYFQEFQDVIGVIDLYEWTLTDGLPNKAILLPWQSVTTLGYGTEMKHFSVRVEYPYIQPRCIFLLLRGYNTVGLSSTVSASLECNKQEIDELLVIDSDEEVTLQQNDRWTQPDIDYINTLTTMSATWPTLRHHDYIWAVVEDNVNHDFQNGLRYPCDFSRTLKCGQTENEFINVHGLKLTEGNRYRICIHANGTTTGQILPAVSVCSNGVVVDTMPPLTGKVWVGLKTDTTVYQISTSEVVVNWEHFTDVEANAKAVLHSGIQFYELAIGTEPGKDNVASYRSVGFTNRSVITKLDLTNDVTYYATVKGTDLVGLTSISSSNAFSVDNTPPSVDYEMSLSFDSAFFRSVDSIVADWSGIFRDDRSGIDYYEWAIGTKPGFSDIISFTRTSDSIISFANLDMNLKEGHPYFINIKAINMVGLTTSKSFGAFRVDTTPPTVGHVYDTLATTSSLRDYDWAPLTRIYASWEGFHDAHSSVIGYSWHIGLCKGCNDVLTQQFVGLPNSTCASHVNVIPGFTYYATVTACNAADLCTSVPSDGITFDDSPPAVGKVYDGHAENDVDYSPNRFLISAHWWGFNDPHSKISHYEWRAGTTPLSDDIMKTISAHHSEFAINILESSLPTNVTIYVTVRAYNRAGLWIEGSSDGYVIDDTEPLIVQDVTRNELFGVENTHSQIVNDVIKISWKFNDFESSIRRQHIYLASHIKGSVNINSLEIEASDNQYTMTNLTLHDGSRYTITVVACNGARLCKSSSSEEFLVDSSPPIVGTFAIASEHAANLGHHQEGWMTWIYHETNNTSSLKLAWLGFSDLHSEISQYVITIGSNFDENDILKNSTFLRKYTDDSSDDHVQKAEIQFTGKILEYGRIYVSLLAQNEVGLKSSRAFSAFDVALSGSDNEGMLVLIRRCEAHSCEGHCVCAPLDKLCPVIFSDCTDVSQDNSNEEIEVFDAFQVGPRDDTIPDESTEDVIHSTPSLTFLAAVWTTKVKKGLSILRYEWSVGRDWSEGSEPQGVYHPALEQVWHDIGQDTSVIVTFGKDKRMSPGNTYQMFIRAWYNDDTYAVFRSDGVTPYVFAPYASTLKGAHINDINVGDQSGSDIDFTGNTNAIAVSWYGVFVRDHEDLRTFEVALGTNPGGEEIRKFSDNVFPKDRTQVTFTHLALRSGRRYFASVRACNKVGLCTTLSSDGFVVDAINPRAGVVREGKGIYYQEYSSSLTTASASWHGFYDLESYVDHYVWCVGTTAQPNECNIISPTNMGLSLAAEREVKGNLTPGHRYFSKVFAVDGDGLNSDTIVTDGFVPDISPPVPLQKHRLGSNLISNPSFEDGLDWDSDPANSSYIISVGKGSAKDGSTVVVVHGEITRRIETVPGRRYMLTFFTTHASADENIFLHQEGLVEIPGQSHVFRLYHRQNHGIISRDVWQKNVFYFIATETFSTIALKSLGQHGMQVDQVLVEEINYQASNSSTLVDVHLQILNDRPLLHASWQFEDNESPIGEYMWAIGSVRGGTQLQDFTSLGDKTSAYILDLTLTHVTSVFVTVVARNRADLTSIAYSKPVPIDFTPPEILYVREERGLTKDLDFINNFAFHVSWKARDDETQILFCDWAVGTKPNFDDATNFTRVSEASLSNVLVQLPERTSYEGQTFFVTVWCQNTAGLSAYASSDGVTIVTSAPDASNAVLNIIASSDAEYAVQDMFQSHTNYIKGYWRGFRDIYGIKYYQCRITGPMIFDTNWKECGSIISTTVELSGLSLVSGGHYHMEVRAINYANLASESIGTNVTIATEPPNVTGQKAGTTVANNTLTVSWQDVFHSSTRLWYEVSIGTILGGSDVMQWVETTEHQISVSPVNKLKDYYITLTAINSVGLSSTLSVNFNG